MLIPHGARALRFATAVVLALGATACAKNAADDASIAGAAGGVGTAEAKESTSGDGCGSDDVGFGGSIGLLANVDAALACARETGYPVILKADAGGGGRGVLRLGLGRLRDDGAAAVAPGRARPGAGAHPAVAQHLDAVLRHRAGRGDRPDDTAVRARLRELAAIRSRCRGSSTCICRQVTNTSGPLMC